MAEKERKVALSYRWVRYCANLGTDPASFSVCNNPPKQAFIHIFKMRKPQLTVNSRPFGSVVRASL